MKDSESKLINGSKSDKTLIGNYLNSPSSDNLTLKQLSYLVMKQAKEKDFGTKPEDINVGEKIALIHSEISEAYEAYRHNIMEGKDSFPKELGDAVERIFHLAGIMGIDLEKEILEKQELNKNRDWNWDEINEKRS